jgi:hypothetical protein
MQIYSRDTLIEYFMGGTIRMKHFQPNRFLHGLDEWAKLKAAFIRKKALQAYLG